MKRGVKKRDHEKLDDATIQRVKDLRESDTPITKKAACEILNISYNSSRLDRILQEFDEKKARRKKNFAANRNKPVDVSEKSRIISWYLEGYGVTELSEMLYRPPYIIKNVLEETGTPIRTRGEEAAKISFIPEQAIRDSFSVGEFVWSAKYQSVCEVIKEEKTSRDKVSKVYQIYVYEKTDSGRKGGRYCAQRAEELGSLEHLAQYIDVKKITS